MVDKNITASSKYVLSMNYKCNRKRLRYLIGAARQHCAALLRFEYAVCTCCYYSNTLYNQSVPNTFLIL